MPNLASKTLLVAAAAGLAAGCAYWRPYGAEEVRGGVMADWYAHQTVYTFDKDTTNPPQSTCDPYCETFWPPVRPAAGVPVSGDFTIIKRADGTQQVAYKGKPLYYYVKDTKTGDKLGDGVGGMWRTVTFK